MPPPDPIAVAKADLRKELLARRDALPAAQRQAAAEAVAARGLPIGLAPGMIVSGYSPLKSEISPLPLLRKCSEAGVRLALPVIARRGKPLIMRAWNFGDEMASGVWGIREPKADAPEVSPDVLIVPMLAFDRRGGRIGYGAGYYDMTIARLRATKRVVAVGLAYSAQEIAEVPMTPHDEKLDFVLTEREAITC